MTKDSASPEGDDARELSTDNGGPGERDRPQEDQSFPQDGDAEDDVVSRETSGDAETAETEVSREKSGAGDAAETVVSR